MCKLGDFLLNLCHYVGHHDFVYLDLNRVSTFVGFQSIVYNSERSLWELDDSNHMMLMLNVYNGLKSKMQWSLPWKDRQIQLEFRCLSNSSHIYASPVGLSSSTDTAVPWRMIILIKQSLIIHPIKTQIRHDKSENNQTSFASDFKVLILIGINFSVAKEMMR